MLIHTFWLLQLKASPESYPSKDSEGFFNVYFDTVENHTPATKQEKTLLSFYTVFPKGV